jgi:transmembrane sensor
VLVSDGAIEVLGTRFTVEQRPAGGKVTLYEGSIRFVADDGRAVLLVPGESLFWPLPKAAPVPAVEPTPAAEPGPEPATPTGVKPVPARPVTPAAPVKSEPEAVRIEELLQRIDELRSRGQFDAAAAELSRALEAGYAEATRERLSFELGTILSRPGSDGQRACAHWRDHAKRFAQGRYDREIEQAVKRLNCAGP